MSFLLVTQAILCRFICESEILESKIYFFRRSFWKMCDQITNDGAFRGVNISYRDSLAEVCNSFILKVLQIRIE